MLGVAIIMMGLMVGTAGAGDQNGSGWLSNCGTENFYAFDTPPVLVDSVAVDYPGIAVRSNLGGTVVVEAAVLADGKLCGAHISQGVHPLLDRSAIEAVGASTYRPALLNGAPVAGIVVVSYRFDAEEVRQQRAARIRPDLTDLNPLLSELPDAVAVDSVEASGETYFYDGIEVRGDISRQHVQTVMTLVRERMELEGEVDDIFLIVVLKDENLFDSTFPGGGYIDWRTDLLVFTCHRRWRDGTCTSGRSHSFRYDKGQFEFVIGSAWIYCVEESPAGED